MSDSGSKTTIICDGIKYDIYSNHVGNKDIYTLCKDNDTIVQLIANFNSYYVSYIKEQDKLDILLSALNGNPKNKKNISIIQSIKHTLPLPVLYKTVDYVFRAYIKKTIYGHFVKIGSEKFSGCMEIIISNEEANVISQIFAEPECSFSIEMLKGGVVQMIKGALQLCKTIFDTNKFELTDNSTIDCISKDLSRRPPRTPKRPLSLAHLYIIDYKKTWYELHFNAKIKEEERYALYRKNLEKLNQPISLDFEKFCRKYYIEQNEALEPFYKKAKSWLDFLQSIPKMERCNLMLWMPTVIDSIIEFKPSHETWIIDVNNMEPTTMIILPIMGGSYKNTTRRNKVKKIQARKDKIYSTFSNSRYLGVTEM